jgi:uncharacterized protein (DUF2225 family)
MSKIVWKEKYGQFGSTGNYGYVGKVCLFIYSYQCLERKDREKPYLLRVNIGINEHTYRYNTPEQCEEGAERMLKLIKEELK